MEINEILLPLERLVKVEEVAEPALLNFPNPFNSYPNPFNKRVEIILVEIDIRAYETRKAA